MRAAVWVTWWVEEAVGRACSSWLIMCFLSVQVAGRVVVVWEVEEALRRQQLRGISFTPRGVFTP